MQRLKSRKRELSRKSRRGCKEASPLGMGHRYTDMVMPCPSGGVNDGIEPDVGERIRLGFHYNSYVEIGKAKYMAK